MSEPVSDVIDWLKTPDGLRAVLEQVFQEATPQQLHAIALYAVRIMGKAPRAKRAQ